MAKQNWLPKKEADRRTLLNNLAEKLSGAYATKYGIAAGELTSLGDFRAWFNWTLDALAHIRDRAQGYTNFRDALGYGKGGVSGDLTPPPGFALAPQPATSDVPPVPIIPVADGWKFVASLVARVKGTTSTPPPMARTSASSARKNRSPTRRPLNPT